MNNRIKLLRQATLDAQETISTERAQLMTQFYKSEEAFAVSLPVRRALSFDYLMTNKALCINANELIVGERGPKPKSTPTYPEVSLHTVKDLDILDEREKVFFKVSQHDKDIYQQEIIPYWKGKSNRDKIMAALPQQWKDAYDAGVFTEFQEQRAPGHTVAGKKIFDKGLKDLIAEVDQSLDKIDYINDTRAHDKSEMLKAMRIAATAIIKYAHRNADELMKMAALEDDDTRKEELVRMSEICRCVPENAPQSFHQALQHYWFFHLGVITELNPWDSFNPGRLDQNLYKYYRHDIDNNIITVDQAKELLMSFWVKFNNHPAPPKMGVTALESNTYTDFALINVGGVKPDGSDATNELTYLILDVIEEMRLLQPSSMVQISKKNPDRLVKRALKIVKTGFGQPSMFNTDALVQEMIRQGKDIVDARNGGCSGCVETGAFGTEAYWLTGYFNLTKILELTLNNGFDKRTKKHIGLKTGELSQLDTFEKLMLAYNNQINHFATIKLMGNNIIERVIAENITAPFLSLIVDDCISSGIDYNRGGARYNTSYIQGVGLGSVTDNLTALRYHVYENKTISLQELKQAIDNNFVNNYALRETLIFDTPKYGNDDDYADDQARAVFEMFFNAIDNKPSTRGGKYRINLLPTTCHVYFGSVIGAMPDGRLAGEPLSEGISPVQGADKCGPTAVLNSAAKLDHIRTGGTLLNQKFTPAFFNDESAYDKLTAVVRSYFRMDGHHIQFNVIDADTLRDAQKNPEKYKNLIVRVAGYSDYFNDLGTDLQNEIINRTEHENC
ncbi:MAG: glycyl radical protein [Bacteroidales bacterium]|nr:glycyl radical protein [Bacteroidales bacterium]